MSDYTRLVASALAAEGKSITVWTEAEGVDAEEAGVQVRRRTQLFTVGGLRGLSRELDALPGPRRILVQYVPHAFGYKAMNYPFCAWLARRREDELWVLFHEAVFPYTPGQPLKHNVLAAVTRKMATTVGKRAERIFVTVEAWAQYLPSERQAEAEWLPIPSNLPTYVDDEEVQALRTSLALGPAEVLIGHFGTYGAPIRDLLYATLPVLLDREPNRHALLIGRGSAAVTADLVRRWPKFQLRVAHRENLPPGETAVSIKACDLALQPFPDGITGRRTSAMAPLGLGVPLLTNAGPLTEDLWRIPDAPLILAPTPDPEAILDAAEPLLARPETWHDLGDRGAAFYEEHFAIERTVKRLLGRT